MAAKKKKKPFSKMNTREKFDYFLKEWVFTIIVAFGVAFLFRTTIASPRHIPTGSMIPTIKIGEFIFVRMFSYDWHIPFTRKSLSRRDDPERGDVIVFEFPLDPSKDYIKRVIGVPGDIIEIRDKRVIINGTPLKLEPVEDRSILEDLAPKYNTKKLSLYKETINGITHYVLWMNDRYGRDFEPFEVPRNSFFVMGDNRDDSADSRTGWFVPRHKVLGKAGFIWFSFDKHHAPYLRFKRFFTGLHSEI